MCSLDMNDGVPSGDVPRTDGEVAHGSEIRQCRVHRTPENIPICLMNDQHCEYALPYGIECSHPNVEQISERHDRIGETSQRVYAFSTTVSTTFDLDALLERLLAILNDCRDLPLESRGMIVLENSRGYLFQVAQYGMSIDWKTDFRWHGNILEDAVTLPGGTIRSAKSDAEGIQMLMLPLTTGEQVMGYTILFAPDTFKPDEVHLKLMASLGEAVSGLVRRSITHEMLRFRDYELEESRENAFRSLRVASQYRDDDTGWHILRMTSFAVAIAKVLGLADKQREMLSLSAPMHDVGKIGIPDAILHKPGVLTPEEFEIIKTHTEIGVKILAGKDPMIAAARDIAGSHHERWDGKGYPKGLAGDEISILARICAVADVFDALISPRPYKEAWDVKVAASWIAGEAGKSFDPEVVRGFEAAMPDILRIRELYRDDVIDPRDEVELPPRPHRESAWVQWDESLSVGIPTIDEHHRYLFELANELFEVVKNKRGVRELVGELMEMESYAKVHFQAEEQMMQRYGYAGLQDQRRHHRAFEARIQEFYEALRENPLVVQFDILSYLRDWLIYHIRIEDAGLRTLLVPNEEQGKSAIPLQQPARAGTGHYPAI